MDFKYSNLCTIYSCSGACSLERRERPCYHSAVENLRSNSSNNFINYSIIVLDGESYAISANVKNACYLNKQQIKTHLKQINKYLNKPVKFTVTNTDYKGFSAFKIDISITGSKRDHLFALTWIRHLYEYPFNLILLDAHRLRRDPKYTFTSYLNLCCLIKGAMKHSGLPYRTDQCFIPDPYVNFHTRQQIEYSLFTSPGLNLVELYEKGNWNSEKRKALVDLPMFRSITETNFWLSEEKFEKRKEAYDILFKEYKYGEI